jgi:hypothetical protein
MLVIRLLDPIEWYMRKGDGEEPPRPKRRRRSSPERATSYGPSGESSWPPPEDDFWEQRRAERERWARDHRARQESLLREFGPLWEAKTRELLDGREVTIPTTGGTLWARLVRFRNGAILETKHESPTGSGHGMSEV